MTISARAFWILHDGARAAKESPKKVNQPEACDHDAVLSRVAHLGLARGGRLRNGEVWEKKACRKIFRFEDADPDLPVLRRAMGEREPG